MDKKLQFIQKVLCLFLCIVIIFSALPITEIVYAKDEVEFYPTSEDAEDEIENMFSTTVKDLTSTTAVLQWLSRQETYSITKTVNGEVEKIYVNVPTLQMLLRNTFYKTMSDGWENDMYTPASEFFPNIGLDKDGNLHTENVMNKFGFDLPTATYSGEYPKLFMSTSNIIPSTFWQKTKAVIKAVFGYSFILAPASDNYKTLYYYNHTYLDSEQEKLIKFIQNYWLLFEKEYIYKDGGNSEYFSSPEQANAEKVTESEGKAAESFVENGENKKRFEELSEKQEKRAEWEFWCTDEDKYYEYDEKYREALDAWQTWNIRDHVPKDWDFVANSTTWEEPPVLGGIAHGNDGGGTWYDENGEVVKAEDLPTKGEKPDWLKYREENNPEPPELSEEEKEFIAEYLKQLDIYTRWQNFITKMDNGTKARVSKDSGLSNSKISLRNHPSLILLRTVTSFFTGSDPIYYDHNKADFIYYSQCLLNTEIDGEITEEVLYDPHLCKKTYNGNMVYGDLFNFYISSGAYRLSYKDSSARTESSTSGGVSAPVSGFKESMITSFFGPRTAPGPGASTNHGAIDIAVSMGTPVYAANSGRVKWVQTGFGPNEFKKGSCGNGLGIIDSSGKIETKYCHLTSVEVSNNATVTQGQLIGYSGNSGGSFGAHLHFETLINGVKTDPLQVMNGNFSAGVVSPERKTNLTRTDALKIITTLQNKLGPAYEEMMKAWVLKMQITADNRGDEVKVEEITDPRVMPYDVDTLKIKSDRQQICVSDPRVELYKNEDPIGGLIFRFDLPLLSIIFNKKGISNFLINTCAGNITKFSVFLMQLMNLEWFEDHGLSPLNMWNSFSFNLIMIILALLLVIQIIRYAIKFTQGQAGIIQVLGRFIIFISLMGLVGLFMLPGSQQQTWTVIKKVFNISSSWVEEVTLENSNNVEELLGDKKDNSVVYYIPYFNMWSSYMTGYNIEAEEQTLNIDGTMPEVQKLKDDNGKILLPTINSKPTKVWSVVLADSFNTLGENHNIVDSTNLITYGKKQIYVNGERVNNNAYRVVDHFIAPRLSATVDTGKDLAKLDNSINENFNGRFQKLDILGLVGKLIGIINIAFMALIKFLTFVWFWYQLYVFVFQILLGAIENRGNVKNVLISTFIPLLQLPMLGLWTTVLMKVSFWVDGFMALIINVVLLYVSYIILQKWAASRYFPPTLKPIALLTRYKYQIESLKENYSHSMLDSFKDEFPDLFDESGNFRYDELFLPDGSRKYKGNEYDKVYYYATREMYHLYRKGGEENIKNVFNVGGLNYARKHGYLGRSDSDKSLSFNNSNFIRNYKQTYDDSRQKFHEEYDEENSNLGETQEINK